jgi:hypothetical protein
MKLQEAFLCMDCDEVFTVEGKTNPECPSCASRSYAPISGWITSWDLVDKLQTLNTGKRPIPAVVRLVTEAPPRTAEIFERGDGVFVRRYVPPVLHEDEAAAKRRHIRRA